MVFTLVQATKDDVPTLVDVYFNTFNSPIVLKLKPNTPSTREWFAKSLEYDFEKPNARIYKIIETNVDQVIAFGKWYSPDKSSKTVEPPTTFPQDGDPKMFEEVLTKVTRKVKEVMGDQDFWYLSIMATLPQHQRKGAASMFMTEFCRQVDEARQTAYLEASPSGKSTYERFGFEVKDTFATMIDGKPYPNSCMVRPAKSTDD